MDQDQTSSLFNLSIEPVTRAQLSETAKWARFLAIAGFIGLGLILIFVVLAGVIFSTVASDLDKLDAGRTATGLAGGFQFIFLLLMVVLYFFPCLFLLRFANKMKIALNDNDQESLNSSVQNLKRLFKFIGILTIILLTFYAIAILVGILSYGFSR